MTDILAFGVHPDDIEFSCGGILARMASEGKSIVMVDLTLGQKSTNGTPEIRKREGEAAANLIGAKRLFLDFEDCEVFDTYEGRLKLVKVIREVRPKLILAPLWDGEKNHPDHLACGQMARYACRYARFKKVLPEIAIHIPEGILHYVNLSNEGRIDFLMDITDHVETWKKMINSHASQMRTFDFAAWNLSYAAKLGALINRPYAQGLAKGQPVVINDLMAISRAAQEI
jgi:bacillithiol biosynthesis deacetylase BshB1